MCLHASRTRIPSTGGKPAGCWCAGLLPMCCQHIAFARTLAWPDAPSPKPPYLPYHMDIIRSQGARQAELQHRIETGVKLGMCVPHTRGLRAYALAALCPQLQRLSLDERASCIGGMTNGEQPAAWRARAVARLCNPPLFCQPTAAAGAIIQSKHRPCPPRPASHGRTPHAVHACPLCRPPIFRHPHPMPPIHPQTWRAPWPFTAASFSSWRSTLSATARRASCSQIRGSSPLARAAASLGCVVSGVCARGGL